MKKSITLGFLSVLSAFSIIGCANDNGSTPPNYREEYRIYVSKGGKLSYLEWIKNRKNDNKNKKEKGDPGVSIKSTHVNEKGELIIELTDGRIINAGKLSDSFDK